MNLTNIAILLAALICISNSINISILRRDLIRIWDVLENLSENFAEIAKAVKEATEKIKR